jgi:hypothetical protein
MPCYTIYVRPVFMHVESGSWRSWKLVTGISMSGHHGKRGCKKVTSDVTGSPTDEY